MKEERIDIGDGLTIDLASHRRNGMTTLTAEDVAMRPKIPFVIKWEKETSFNPQGITLEGAMKAVEKCK
jgi:hypothetical protein